MHMIADHNTCTEFNVQLAPKNGGGGGGGGGLYDVSCFPAKREDSLLYTTAVVSPIPPAAENTRIPVCHAAQETFIVCSLFLLFIPSVALGQAGVKFQQVV